MLVVLQSLGDLADGGNGGRVGEKEVEVVYGIVIDLRTRLARSVATREYCSCTCIQRGIHRLIGIHGCVIGLAPWKENPKRMLI